MNVRIGQCVWWIDPDSWPRCGAVTAADPHGRWVRVRVQPEDVDEQPSEREVPAAALYGSKAEAMRARLGGGPLADLWTEGRV